MEPQQMRKRADDVVLTDLKAQMLAHYRAVASVGIRDARSYLENTHTERE